MIGHRVVMLSENDPQHSLKHLSRSQRDVAGPVVKVLGLSTSTASNHECLLLGPYPHKIFLTTTPGYLVEAHAIWENPNTKCTVEIGKAQEAPKLSECGWGWPVMDDLDLGWIHMYTMLINDVA
jgi:hypothetical protein